LIVWDEVEIRINKLCIYIVIMKKEKREPIGG
jgi:hypothetical protein